MKYNKLFVLAFASLALLTSCEDAYDIKQPGEQNDPNKVYNTLEDFQSGLNGVYERFSPEKTIEFTSIFTDETAIGVTNGGQGVSDGLYQFRLTAGTDAAISIWHSNYTLINFTNRIISVKDRIKANIEADYEGVTEQSDPVAFAEKEALIDSYEDALAQLYAIRAYSHFQLISWFSTDPSNPDALGAMLFDFVPDYEYQTFLPRVPNRDIYALIDSDLATATTLFTAGNVVTSDNTKVSPNFIKSLRARMALYRKDYATAAQLSHELIGNYSSTLVATPAAYYDLWADNTATEFLFKLVRVNGDFGIGSYWASQASNINGSPFFEVSRGLYNSYTVNTDIRNTFFTPSGGSRTGTLVDATSVLSPNPDSEPDYANGDILVVNKYPGNEEQGDNLLNDIKVFTYGEMFLIRAEALANLGAINGLSNSNTSKVYAQDVMRALRRRRYASASYAQPAYTDLKDALTDIQLERRRELAFQGHRYLDIKRLGPVTGQGVSRYSRDCQQYSACTLEPTSYKFTLPIPSTEMTANANIRSQQNPGY
ncbi:MAG: RagB/SusD family nutrient uptake outer membrane protein [Bacteroidia bacterium]